MKNYLLFIAVAFLATGCYGPGGPATRTGRAIDRGADAVGRGIERTGEKIQDVAH